MSTPVRMVRSGAPIPQYCRDTTAQWIVGAPQVKGRRLKKIGPDNAVAAIRMRAFLRHHGRTRTEKLRECKSKGGRRGWWEMTAADGYKLRCDWVRTADEEQLTYSEIAPESEN
jgi:hypothetical protein